mmetsp:Transcript_12674/g.27804  ORF Transcript_12674/g.27804 Transcript_12674/m.27804 type:complete len:80 (+) Transcript_12674:524-763(+)
MSLPSPSGWSLNGTFEHQDVREAVRLSGTCEDDFPCRLQPSSIGASHSLKASNAAPQKESRWDFRACARTKSQWSLKEL